MRPNDSDQAAGSRPEQRKRGNRRPLDLMVRRLWIVCSSSSRPIKRGANDLDFPCLYVSLGR